jgi:hypothetical protein
MSIRIPMVRNPAARAALLAPWLVACLALASCGGGGDDPGSRPVALSFDFSGGIGGWSGASADYQAATAPIDVVWAHAALPPPLAGSGFRLSGTNRSDDLFIYVKRQVGGLQPGRTYGVAMQVRLATSAPSGCAGAGGPPGEGVWVHAGATASEPRTVLQGTQEYRVNIDRGNQSLGGSQGVVMGTIANGNTDCLQRRFATKLLSSHAPHAVTADGTGHVWLHAGIDSGFEAYSEVYLQSLEVVFTPR